MYALLQYYLILLTITIHNRAKAINTQLGQEEASPFFKLKVTGDPNNEVMPSIVIKPRDTTVVKNEDVYLHCIANAR